MTVELLGVVEKQLRTLAARQGRAVSVLVEDAVREYLEAAAITDLNARASRDLASPTSTTS